MDKATISALNKRVKELEEQNVTLLKDYEILKTELVRVKDGQELFEYGLSRGNILSRKWHEANPQAAKHFFGFTDWKDTVYKLVALFDVSPPMDIPSKTTPLSVFEKYLMALMRIHTRMTVYTISVIWGRTGSYTSQVLAEIINVIGNAGKYEASRSSHSSVC